MDDADGDDDGDGTVGRVLVGWPNVYSFRRYDIRAAYGEEDVVGVEGVVVVAAVEPVVVDLVTFVVEVVDPVVVVEGVSVEAEDEDNQGTDFVVVVVGVGVVGEIAVFDCACDDGVNVLVDLLVDRLMMMVMEEAVQVEIEPVELIVVVVVGSSLEVAFELPWEMRLVVIVASFVVNEAAFDDWDVRAFVDGIEAVVVSWVLATWQLVVVGRRLWPMEVVGSCEARLTVPVSVVVHRPLHYPHLALHLTEVPARDPPCFLNKQNFHQSIYYTHKLVIKFLNNKKINFI